MEVAQRALDGALVLARGFMVGALELGVADVGTTVLAPVFWCGFPVFGHGNGVWTGRGYEKVWLR